MSSIWFNPDNKTVYGNHDTDQVVQVGVNDIGDRIEPLNGKIKYNFISNTAECDTQYATTPIWINGSNKPFAYVEDTSSGTTADVWNTRMSFANGPMSTAIYKDTGTTAWSYEFTLRAHNHYNDTFGLRWHHDNQIEDGVAYVWDNEYTKPLSQKVIDKANKKSMKLLKEWLSDAEYKYLMEEGNLELPSQHEKDTIYIVNKDPMKRIGIKKKGKVVEKSLCIHTSNSYPTGDVLLANIMLLKTDEKKFLEIANVHDFYV